MLSRDKTYSNTRSVLHEEKLETIVRHALEHLMTDDAMHVIRMFGYTVKTNQNRNNYNRIEATLSKPKTHAKTIDISLATRLSHPSCQRAALRRWLGALNALVSVR